MGFHFWHESYNTGRYEKTQCGVFARGDKGSLLRRHIRKGPTMKQMLKNLKEKKGGFTLVELIVVLVILAILAAILVPTLIGYINQANSEKDYATAQTVRVAAQAVADDQYGRGTAKDKIALTDATASGETVAQLAGVTVSDKEVSAASFDVDPTSHAITGGTVTINGHTYSLANNQWSVTN
jgi:prepilin-type N-terminal cleavage/methylation domain-containing protein